mmetsp:Transcript_41322/g.93087  ORF Transcript_41322/g.93087 Transcript_41322/m.93087 type:complete len:217 (+) Transcript_41322:302-952(+)
MTFLKARATLPWTARTVSLKPPWPPWPPAGSASSLTSRPTETRCPEGPNVPVRSVPAHVTWEGLLSSRPLVGPSLRPLRSTRAFTSCITELSTGPAERANSACCCLGGSSAEGAPRAAQRLKKSCAPRSTGSTKQAATTGSRRPYRCRVLPPATVKLRTHSGAPSYGARHSTLTMKVAVVPGSTACGRGWVVVQARCGASRSSARGSTSRPPLLLR